MAESRADLLARIGVSFLFHAGVTVILFLITAGLGLFVSTVAPTFQAFHGFDNIARGVVLCYLLCSFIVEFGFNLWRQAQQELADSRDPAARLERDALRAQSEVLQKRNDLLQENNNILRDMLQTHLQAGAQLSTEQLDRLHQRFDEH